MKKTKSKNERSVKRKPTFERVPSGVPGLDKYIGGGFIKGSSILVAGGPGAGKTIFSSYFIYEGLKRGENCLYLTLEERPQDIVADTLKLGINLEKYLRNGKLEIKFIDAVDVSRMSGGLLPKLRDKKIHRVVIDSISLFELYYKTSADVRKQLMKIIFGLKKFNVTTIFTSEIPSGKESFGSFGIEEFVTDSVITLRSMIMTGESGRSLSIVKMRRTDHSGDIHPVKLDSKGMKVLPPEKGIKI